MHWKYKTVDFANFVVILITLILFSLALFTKGFTHDLLLEIAIFLVSAKIILAVQQLKYLLQSLADKIDRK